MAVKLFGNTNNLQGGGGSLQGGYNPLQAGNPQQVYNPVAPKPAAVVAPKAPTVVVPKPVIQTAQPLQINPLYAQYVQTRPSKVNPGVLEYYNPSNQVGFSNPNDVFNYLRTMTGQSFNDLKQLEAGYGNAGVNTQIQSIDPYQTLAEQAGMAGIGYDDYLKLIQSQNGLSQAEQDQIKQSLGIPDLEGQIFQPAPSTEKLYADAYSSAGLDALKSKIDTKLKEITDAEKIFTDKTGKLNENPWLSEASRIGRARVLNDQAEMRIGNLKNELASLTDLYNSGVGEINNLVTRQTTDFTNNQTLNTAKLNYLLGKAEEQIAGKQSEKLSSAYSYLPAYLQAKAKAQKPDTFGSSDTGYYSWNPNTGTFEQVVAPQIDPYRQLQIQDLQQKISGGNLTTEQKNKVASIGVLQQTISSIEQLGSQIGWSGVGGAYKGSISQFLAKNFGTGSQQEQMLRSFIGNLQATIAKERGGTSFTANEQALLEQYTPTINDSPSVIQSKLAALKQYFNSSLPTGGTNTGANPSDPLGIRFNQAGNASASTPYLKTLGTITGGNGSELWSYGLDVDLKKGDPVRSPVSGVVIAAAPNGGFGNQVKIKTSDGNEIWLSHLDSGSVKVGQVVNAGQIVGIGGNTGNTIALNGGDGSHLDITMKDKSGKLLTAPQVKSYLDTKYV